MDWSWPAELDPGRSDSRLTGSDWVHTGVQAVLSGGQSLNMGTLGALARTLAPADGAAPLAGQIEYRWPISPAEERGNAHDDEVLLTLFGGGDLRDQARDLAMTVPVAELRDAFQLAAWLPGWADNVCAAVEREIAAGQPGDAAKEWITSTFGLTRLLLATVLRDKNASPASTAVTALVLIFVRNAVRTLRQLVPSWNYEVLKNPLVAPPFLIDFFDH